MSAGKVMNDIPTSAYDVQSIRNAGWPTGRETYGHGVSTVVRERESLLHGEVEQVDDSEY